jgi:calcineurin-like phosphoesterase family protein
MYRTLLDNWKSVVRPGDEVYILGDLSFDDALGAQFLREAPGQKFMVWGNHDPKRPKDRTKVLAELVRSADIMETKLKSETHVVMCHYPIIRWNRGHFGTIMLHGHTHGEFRIPDIRLLDVGADSEFDVFDGRRHRRYFPVAEHELTYWERATPIYGHHYYPGDEK